MLFFKINSQNVIFFLKKLHYIKNIFDTYFKSKFSQFTNRHETITQWLNVLTFSLSVRIGRWVQAPVTAIQFIITNYLKEVIWNALKTVGARLFNSIKSRFNKVVDVI